LTLNRSEIDEITAPKSPSGDLGVGFRGFAETEKNNIFAKYLTTI